MGIVMVSNVISAKIVGDSFEEGLECSAILYVVTHMLTPFLKMHLFGKQESHNFLQYLQSVPL